MQGAPIRILNRYTGQYEEEAVYGEGALRFAYETSLGRGITGLVFSRPFLSRLFGWYMKRPGSRSKIAPFVEQYGLDPETFSRPLDSYSSFNDFFRRELKPGVRPVDPDPRSVVFPADGRHLGWQEVGTEAGVFVKGQRWNLDALLGGDAQLLSRFEGGSLVLSRLCPVDYHHFHFPASGEAGDPHWTGKRLYSVSPFSLRHSLAYLWQNKRCLTILENEAIGPVAFIEVGATNVGTIRHRPLPGGRQVRKGDPKGWFEFGGSSVLTIFPKGAVSLSTDLLETTAAGVELYAHVGDRMGTFS